ncbi:MAG: DNA-binding NtrC family response regulator [Paracoccaceae bacterium]
MNKQQPNVLIVDDDKEIRESLAEYFRDADWAAKVADSAKTALDIIQNSRPDVVVTDVHMPGMDGIELFRRIIEMDPDIPVLMITAYGDIPMAIEATRSGVVDFIEKPFDPERILAAAKQAAESADLRVQNSTLLRQLNRLTGLDAILVGESPKMQRLREDICRIAEIDVSVLVIGETGTGKELVARAIHNLSPRAGRRFVPVDFPAIAAGEFEAELFGRSKPPGGAPLAPKRGAMRMADGGSILFNEIEKCPLSEQSKLFRALDSKRVTPVGSDTEISVDIRVISSAETDPKQLADSGQFRDSLYYDISTIVLAIPPLRERGNDIILLFNAYLERFARLYAEEPPQLAPSEIAALLNHPWPGNTRELSRVAERYVLSAKGGGVSGSGLLGLGKSSAQQATPLKTQVEAYERVLIAEVLAQVDGSMDDVAAHLGIGRRTLNEKLVKYGLQRK